MTKTVSPDPLGIAANWVFPITLACTSPTGGHYALNLHGNSTAAPIVNLTIGGSCTIAETLPLPPHGCTWQPPVYSPATVTIAGGMNTVTVTNSYTCPPPSGYLNIFKSITNQSSPSGTTFTINANCSNGYNHTESGISPGNAWPPTPLPYGTTCTITEPTLPPPFTNFQGQICTWQQQAPLSQTVTINSPTQSVTVTNSFTCAPQSGYLNIYKSITNATWPPGTTFAFNANCSNGYNHTQSGLSPGTSWSLNPLPYGTTCTITEPALPPPFTDAQGANCTWHQQAPLSQTVTINGPTQSVTVTNSFKCAQEASGSLTLQKIVSPDPMSIGGTLSFPMSVTCTNPAGSHPLTVQGNSTAAPIALPLGSHCTVAEGSRPPLPPGCVWLPPQYSPQPVTIGTGTNHATVTNGYACIPEGSLTVTKAVKNITGGTLPSMSFPVTVTCNLGPPLPPITMPFTLSDGGSHTVNNIIAGSTCTVTEVLPTPPNNVCAAGSVAVWLMPVYSPPSVVISATSPVTIAVHNTLKCEPVGSLTVTKTLTNNTGATLPSIAFPLTVTCNPAPPTPAITVPFSLLDGGSHTVNNIITGSACTVTEVLPPLPHNVCPQGFLAEWSPPTYTPPSVVISATTATIAVHNTLNCKSLPPGSLTVTKTLTNNSAFTLPYTLMAMTVTCGSLIEPFSLADGQSHTVTNIPPGASCTVTETLPNWGEPANVCPQTPVFTVPMWSAPTYTPASVIIASGMTATITVHNTFRCEDKFGGFRVAKTLTDNTGQVPASLTYRMDVSCPPVTYTTYVVALPNYVFQPGNSLAYGTVCTVTEVSFGALPNVCPAGTVPKWSAPTYTPPSLIVAAPMSTITVHNELNCVQHHQLGAAACDPATTIQRGNECACRYPNMARKPDGACACAAGLNFVAGRGCIKPIACRPPLVPNAAGGECVCPPGSVQRGRTCVRPVECRAPMVPNAAGTACACPAGSVQRGGSCIQPTVCSPPAKLNRRGACECPSNMVLRGNICVEQPRNPRSPRDGHDAPGGPRGGNPEGSPGRR